MSQHSFDTEVAKEHGIEAAIILQNISFWIEKNKANEKHFHDGEYWTYNSIKAFNELFPYMSESTIRRTLKALEEKELIKTGCYNKAGYDRTLWYAITKKGLFILNKSICQFEQMDLVKTANAFSQSSKPIPDNKPVKKQDNKLPNELYTEIEEAYLKNYESLFSKLPVLIYPVIRKKIKTLIDNGITKDQILLAIETAKNDSWIKSTGFEITTILSEKVLPRLINASSQNSFSKKINSAPRLACPRCGSEIIGGICTQCRNLVNEDGKEVM